MKNLLFVLIVVLGLVTTPAQAQQSLPFTVTMIELDRSALKEIGDLYRVYSGERELLWCVVDWTKRPLTNGIDQITIHDVEVYTAAGRRTIPDVERSCLDRDGKPQPTIHTHNEGNCQPSPWDITTIMVRNAPFDGIQCGTKQVMWFFAAQFQAMAKAYPAY
jgi:hypothetical protein